MAENPRRPRTDTELRLERAISEMRVHVREIAKLAPFPENLKKSLTDCDQRVKRIKDHDEDAEHS
jgi:hypothetical protein